MPISIRQSPTHALIKMWLPQSEVEQAATTQIENTASLPFIFKHLAIMPDVHYGIGATVGSVVATLRQVICVKG